MSVNNLLFKMAFGALKVGKSTGCHDGEKRTCPKCGMISYGPCKSCLSKEGTELILDGIKSLKNKH